MAYALALIRYRRPLDEVLPHVDAHREYLKSLQEKGQLLASGPFNPRNGGALLLRLEVEGPALVQALDAIRDQDPFVIEGLAQYELLPWEPVIGREALDTL
jgi:uncharacterized protein YciI